MTKATRAGGAIAAVCLLAATACSSDGDETMSESAPTAAPATAVEDASDEPTTTEPPETTPSTAAPTTEPPATTEPATVVGEEYLGIVWESAADPERVNTTEGRPELVDGPMSIRVDMFLSTPGPDESAFCADAVEDATGPDGKPLDLPEVTSCLIVEWQFDAPACLPAGCDIDHRRGYAFEHRRETWQRISVDRNRQTCLQRQRQRQHHYHETR